MRTLGQENVFSCTMDGACKGAFPIIQAQLPWVQCFVCPSHTIDGFIKNALSDTATIRIQANAMSHVEFATIAWGETMFKNTDETAWQGPTHKRARCGRFRWWWHWFWRQHCASRPTLIEWVVGFSLSHNEECIETVSMHMYSIYWHCQYIHVYWTPKCWVYIERVCMKVCILLKY